MPDPGTFESRLAAAYERWAAEMPAEVDAFELVRRTRSIAGAPGRIPMARLLVAAALLALLLAVLVATFVLVGGQPPRSPMTYEGVFAKTGSLVHCFGIGEPRPAPVLLEDGRVLIYPQIFDPATDTLSDLGSLECSDRLTVGLADGRVLLVGTSPGTTDAGLLDPATGVVTRIEPPALEVLSAARLEDGRVLLLSRSSAAIYEPSDGTTQDLGRMSRSADMRSSTLLSDGRVLVASRRTGSPARAQTWAEVFDPATGIFEPTGEHLDPLLDVTNAVRLDEGTVLFAGGGTDLMREAIPSAELYDPDEGTFTYVGPMGEPRSGAAMALLGDGRVLVTGGLRSQRRRIGESDEILASAELFDPSTGGFEPTGSMALARMGHAAVALPDGRVLIVGGGADTEAELYH